MKVYCHDEQQALAICTTSVEALACAVLHAEGHACDELSVHFVSSEAIAELHDEFFQDPSTTDCISFPIDGPDAPYRVLGELFVCPQTALSYIQTQGGDPYEETSLYVVHGLLHLMGYDDLEEADEQQMRAAEQRHMTALRQKGLLLRGRDI